MNGEAKQFDEAPMGKSKDEQTSTIRLITSDMPCITPVDYPVKFKIRFIPFIDPNPLYFNITNLP